MTQHSPPPTLPGLTPHCGNPIIPGYYAVPSLVQYGGKFFLFATLDPWGGDTLGCWESDDFKNWTYRVLNWPTVEQCTSPSGQTAKVWAPSVVQGRDGRFYLYVSVRNEVWVGVAEHPLGPWRNLLHDGPLIAGDYRPGFHMIDAEAFIDEDGSAWLYWGSGWNWENGRCWAAKLAPDMASFEGEVQDVSPDNYFEAPFMFKRSGRYYLMYSNGRTDLDTYQVHYAVGEHPLGPFTEAPNSPILVTDKAANIHSPGHHAVFSFEGRDYILYHRHSIPFDPDFIGRQLCVDELHFTADGWMENVRPTHEGPALVRHRGAGRTNLAAPASATASSQAGPLFGAARVLDGNYASRWAAAPDAAGAWLQLDLGARREFAMQELRFEYAWKPYRFTFEISQDGENWQPVADYTEKPALGSPILISAPGAARYLRLVFPADVSGQAISLFEWAVY
ncbi:MAG: family 43 glycosylhydrolase [Armatimonadota bacterium]|nr:family 43 glycosylhydrolase [Armatimonadota bacterium]